MGRRVALACAGAFTRCGRPRITGRPGRCGLWQGCPIALLPAAALPPPLLCRRRKVRHDIRIALCSPTRLTASGYLNAMVAMPCRRHKACPRNRHWSRLTGTGPKPNCAPLIAPSSKGKTTDSDSVYRGSNPRGASIPRHIMDLPHYAADRASSLARACARKGNVGLPAEVERVAGRWPAVSFP